MFKIRFLPFLAVFTVLAGCAAGHRPWPNDFRLGLVNNDFPDKLQFRHALVPQFIDSISAEGEQFYLYYFTRGPTDSKKPLGTILFCSGGPGEVLWPGQYATVLQKLEAKYRVVYFHIRGAGFSQLPASNRYDRYLRTKYAVKDIDRIFEHLRRNQDSSLTEWDAVVGFSYGTVLAQQYTEQNRTKVGKLILLSPLSRHLFKRPINDPERTTFVNAIYSEYGTVLRDIFSRDTKVDDKGLRTNEFKQKFPKFFELAEQPDYNRNTIIDDIDATATEIFRKLDSALLTVRPLIDSNKDPRLIDLGLEQSQLGGYRPFVQDLHQLRFAGWGNFSNASTEAGRAVRIAAQAILLKRRIDVKAAFIRIKHLDVVPENLCGLLNKPEWRERFAPDAQEYGMWDKDKASDAVCLKDDAMKEEKQAEAKANAVEGKAEREAKKAETKTEERTGKAEAEHEAASPSSGSRRVFYNMAIYDGLDPGFLDKWNFRPRSTLVDFFKKIMWWRPDPFLKRVGFTVDEEPDIWDPKYHKHERPTLIVRGNSDPVTAGGQADYFFNEGLTGHRYLVKFDGIGHDLNVNPRFDATPACKSINIIMPCIIESFIKSDFETLEKVLHDYNTTYLFRPKPRPNTNTISDHPVTCKVKGADKRTDHRAEKPICVIESFGPTG